MDYENQHSPIFEYLHGKRMCDVANRSRQDPPFKFAFGKMNILLLFKMFYVITIVPQGKEICFCKGPNFDEVPVSLSYKLP